MILKPLVFSALTLLLVTAINMAGSFPGMGELQITTVRVFLAYCTLIAGSQMIYRLSILLKPATRKG